MPRDNRGGQREGQTGKAYPNRSDLNQGTATHKPGSVRPYGGVSDREVRQATPNREQGAPQQEQPAPATPQPGGLGPLDGPPGEDEPLTSGMDEGPGEGRPQRHMSEDPAEMLRAMYRAAPLEEIRELIQEANDGRS